MCRIQAYANRSARLLWGSKALRLFVSRPDLCASSAGQETKRLWQIQRMQSKHQSRSPPPPLLSCFGCDSSSAFGTIAGAKPPAMCRLPSNSLYIATAEAAVGILPAETACASKEFKRLATLSRGRVGSA